MSNEFQEKLQLYKEGKLNETEMAEIEAEIDKFLAISDYLNNEEKEFLEELRQQPTADIIEENRIAKLLKRRVNLRIILLTAFSAFSALVFFIFIYFAASKLTTSLFALDTKEAFVKREAMAQLARMFQPKYKVYESTVSAGLFAKQNIRVSLENTVGNTNIDKTELNVKFKFGKPIRLGEALVPPLIFENFPYSVSHEANSLSVFKVLENAPQGTKAKILVEFNKPLTAKQIKENFISKISNADTAPLDFTPIAAVGSKLILANPSYFQCRTFFPYDKNTRTLQQDNAFNQQQYANMDDQAHKESLIDNLNLIKNNLRLLQIMYYNDMFKDINFDDLIKQVENNGAEYVGMYISADSKELLKLKSSPVIHCIGVENIVVW